MFKKSFLRTPSVFNKLFKAKVKPKASKSYSFTDDQIRTKAYELWQRRGTESSSQENWDDAVKELIREQQIKKILRPIRRLWWQTGLERPVQAVWKWTGISKKRGWDFLQLLIAPTLLAVIALWLQEYVKQKDIQQQDDKARQDTLVKYFDQMADLLKDGLLTAKPDSEKFIIAQAKTVIALQSLDRKRQHLVIQFLQAAGLNKNSESEKTDPKKLKVGNKVLLYKAQMTKANLANSDLSGAIFIEANLEGTNFGCVSPDNSESDSCSNLTNVNFRGANLRDADLSHANLGNADLSHANLTNANLRNANIGQSYFRQIVHRNVKFIIVSPGSTNLREAKLFAADLRHTNLRYADLSHTDLRRADLRYADLSDAVLRDADLSDADLRYADLSDAVLRGADLSNADLSYTDLRYADLRYADLRDADLSNADLGDANLSYARNLVVSQIKSAKGWEKAHYDPEFRKQLGLSPETSNSDNP